MANIANIVAFDGAATPVLHTLLPVSVSRESKTRVVAEWREDKAGVPVYAQVRLTMKLERLKSGVYRLERRLEVPVQEVVTGANSAGYSATPKVAFVNTDIRVNLFHERSDSVNRRLIRQMGINIDGNIATSVAAATTGFVPDLVDLLVSAT